jgi:uncharacterized protein (TIGR02145 family)
MKNNRLVTISLITLLVVLPLLVNSCNEEPNTIPTAEFTISPSFGTTDSIFVFDASGVKDIEDAEEDLQVRWDWESDSIYDTDFSTNKVAEHKYDIGGAYYITMEVKDTRGMTNRTTEFLRVNWNNRAPKASFNVSPDGGFLQDIFLFNASSSSDPEDKTSDLYCRWDFNGDGTWDTEYSKEKTAQYQYESAGLYEVMLEVKDSEGETDRTSYTLVVGGTNQGPEAPGNPVPGNGSANASTLCVLEWTCVDPENDALVYDVYFGEDANPPLVASDLEVNQYSCLPLEYETDYYWKIVARDPYGHSVTGEVWQFVTNAPVNPMGTFRDARNGQIYKTVDIDGKLWMAENLNIGSMINASTGGLNGDGYQKDTTKIEKFCYNNDPKNCEIYGGLYQWDAAMRFGEVEGSGGICPEGWHIPTQAEWRDLYLYYEEDLGVNSGSSLMLGSQSGFQALFSGYLIFAERKFFDNMQAGYFWSSTINDQINHLAMGRAIYRGKFDFQEDTYQRVNGLPIRCIKNY